MQSYVEQPCSWYMEMDICSVGVSHAHICQWLLSGGTSKLHCLICGQGGLEVPLNDHSDSQQHISAAVSVCAAPCFSCLLPLRT